MCGPWQTRQRHTASTWSPHMAQPMHRHCVQVHKAFEDNFWATKMNLQVCKVPIKHVAAEWWCCCLHTGRCAAAVHSQPAGCRTAALVALAGAPQHSCRCLNDHRAGLVSCRKLSATCSCNDHPVGCPLLGMLHTHTAAQDRSAEHGMGQA